MTFPDKPSFGPAAREATFGRFDYTETPTASEPDGITITGGWAQANIGIVEIPQLNGVPFGWGGKSKGKVWFYRRAHKQLQDLFRDWETAGALKCIETFDGAWNARFMRKRPHTRENLSNHAWGTALDLNASWNGLGKTPALHGTKGCVYELVRIANDNGFYWGGHFGAPRADGMHFEVATLAS